MTEPSRELRVVDLGRQVRGTDLSVREVENQTTGLAVVDARELEQVTAVEPVERGHSFDPGELDGRSHLAGSDVPNEHLALREVGGEVAGGREAGRLVPFRHVPGSRSDLEDRFSKGCGRVRVAVGSLGAGAEQDEHQERGRREGPSGHGSILATTRAPDLAGRRRRGNGTPTIAASTEDPATPDLLQGRVVQVPEARGPNTSNVALTNGAPSTVLVLPR